MIRPLPFLGNHAPRVAMIGGQTKALAIPITALMKMNHPLWYQLKVPGSAPPTAAMENTRHEMKTIRFRSEW